MEFSPAACVSSLGTAAVIDGSQILLTPLRHTVIPPPLAAAVVQTSQRVSDAPAVACMALRDAEGALPEVCLLLHQHRTAAVLACFGSYCLVSG